MKKKIIYIFILFLILMPIKIFAAEIVDTEITGVTEKNIGEEFILDFKVNLTEFDKSKTLGIWIAGFELIFDDQLLVLSDVSSEDFDSYIYKEDDKYYVISEVLENNNSDNMCSNKILYCGNYQVSVKFYIKNTELTETSIKMGEIEIGLLDMNDETKTYTLDDLISLNKITDKTHTIKINKTTNEITKEPVNIIKDEKPVFKEPQTTNKKEETNNIKSSNAFIKELKIDNYNINFEKNKTNYILTLEEDINELDIKVKLENENATYKIIGADDLKNNNNEIAIVVTAEDNTILTYTINIKHEEIKKENETKVKLDIKELINKYFTKENLTYAGIIGGIIIIIILIIILINKRQNKKINKLLGEL